MPVTRINKPLMKNLYALRALLLTVVALLVGAFAFSQPTVHAFLLGAALGMLVGATGLAFSIKSVEVTELDQPADVAEYRITG